MPTPLEILLDPVSLTVLGLYGALILLEALFPARQLPQVKGWRTRALIVFVCHFYLSSYLPLLWGDTLLQYQLFDLTALNPFVGAAIGVVIYELFVFQHINVRTPQWLGYIVQRPESHSVHHGRGVHHYNYSDLPLFDILFGTFRNPKEFVAECGFYNGASAKLPQLLVFKDIAGSEFDPAMRLR